MTPWTAAYQVPPSRDFQGKSTGVACHCLLRRSPGDTVNLRIQTQKVHVDGSPASLGCSQVLPPAGGGPTCRVYRRGSSVCAGAFVIVLGLFRLLFCLSCTRGEGGWSPALSCPGSHPILSSLHCPRCGPRPIHAESSPMSK